jgi:glucan endo-1,3-alpha-glucosidase
MNLVLHAAARVTGCLIRGRSSVRPQSGYLAPLTIFAIILLEVLPLVPADANPKPLVFAHYMVCCTLGGNDASVDQLSNEIELAKRYDIDGFVLNVGAWDREPFYQHVVSRFFEAARRMGGFKLFISVDNCCGLTPEEAVDMVRRFGADPAYFQLNGKPVLSTFVSNPQWGSRVGALLKVSGLPITYVPHVFPDKSPETPAADAIGRLFAQKPQPDGYFYFGAAGTGDQIAASSRAYAKIASVSKRIYMAPVTPYYLGFGKNNRSFDNQGFSAMESEWRAAIEGGATWVEIVTWNDFNESTYVRPFGGVHFRPATGQTPALLPHDGFLDASLPYIRWFHTGHLPSVAIDQIHVFFRPNPASNCDPAVGNAAQPCVGGWKALADRLYLVIEARQPTRVTVLNGAVSAVFDVPAGRTSRSVALVKGPIAITATSGGEERHWASPFAFSLDNRYLRAAMFASSF